MPSTAELQSRQQTTAQAESRMIALGQESFLAGRHGETWVTDPNSGVSRTLAEWVSIIQNAGSSTLLVSAIDPPTPEPETDGAQWYDPSTGVISVWYNGEWVALGEVAPSSPTPLTGQDITVTVGPVATLIKLLDLPVPYFDGGQSYYAQFPNAHAAGWSDPSFFPFGVHLSPAQAPHAANLVAAGVNYYEGIEHNIGNVASALAAGMNVDPQVVEWTQDEIDAEDGDNNPLVFGYHIDDEPEMAVDRGLATVLSRVATCEGYNDGRLTRVNVGNGILGYAGIGAPYYADTDEIVRAVDVASVDQYSYSLLGIRNNIINSPFWPGPGLDPDEARRAATQGWLCDRMKSFQDAEEKKPFYIVVETARPLVGESVEIQGTWITLPQTSGALWSAIRHGARGCVFFQHNNDGINDYYSLSADSGTVIRGNVTALTTEVSALAAVIDGPTYEWDFGDADVETCLKAYGDDAYIFAGPSLSAPLPGGGESDIEQTGTTLQFASTATTETGTVSSTIEVPTDAELVVVTVSGRHGTNSGFEAMTFTKGASDTAMTKATSADASGASWQSALFYLDMPDTGASKSLKWNWLGAPAAGPRIFSVSFWRGIDLSEPVRDSDGVQDTGFPLESPTLVETPTLAAADGDKMLVFCGMNNPGADGSAAVNVWKHAIKLEELTHSGVAEGALATGTPDGDCTVGFENISAATEVAVAAITMKAATLEEVTTTVEQTGTSHTTGTAGSTNNTGTMFLPADVPADCTLVLAAVWGFTGIANFYETLTMPKGGVDTPMIRLPGGDIDDGMWQTALFYMVNPDTGSGKAINWDWLGSASAAVPSNISLTFWKGVDTADPIRDNRAVQTDGTFPTETPMLTNREGDLAVAFFGGYISNSEGTVDTWKNVTTLEQLTHTSDIYDGAWATASVLGSMRIGVETVTGFAGGALVAVALKPSAAVTPITPAADPPTTARSVITGTFTLPPDLSAATTVEVLNESRSIPVTAGAFTDTFDEEWSYHNYRIAIP